MKRRTTVSALNKNNIAYYSACKVDGDDPKSLLDSFENFNIVQLPIQEFQALVFAKKSAKILVTEKVP